ncbi:unnamed protein product [Rhizoctonia solani]|uniref:Uncharacterized protein n=1 Tax=Rhizoctonia solani TaxID=456999 RepID=A0A8H3AY14_9AGAM|nr:unnamed protein product [Rhizoctonia solani]
MYKWNKLSTSAHSCCSTSTHSSTHPFYYIHTITMAATTMPMPSQIQNGTAYYPSLDAYNSALYEYTRKQFEEAQQEARLRLNKRQTSGSKSRANTSGRRSN